MTATLANCTSLLYRLERAGLNVGPRSKALAEQRTGAHHLAFADARFPLATLGASRLDQAARFVHSMHENTTARIDHDVQLMHRVGVPLAEGVLALYSCAGAQASAQAAKTMNLREKTTILRANCSIFGVATTFKMAVAHLWRGAPDDFDARHDVDTDGVLAPDAARLPAADIANARYCIATNAYVLAHVLRRLPIVHRDYDFIDLGCGKGRAIIAAMAYPYRKICGVELSPVAAAIARQNVERRTTRARNRPRCETVEILEANAAAFEFPRRNFVLYLYRPFLAPVLERVVNNLARTASAAPASDILVAYTCPLEQHVLTQSGCFEQLEEYRCISVDHSWSLWRYAHGRRACVG